MYYRYFNIIYFFHDSVFLIVLHIVGIAVAAFSTLANIMWQIYFRKGDKYFTEYFLGKKEVVSFDDIDFIEEKTIRRSGSSYKRGLVIHTQKGAIIIDIDCRNFKEFKAFLRTSHEIIENE